MTDILGVHEMAQLAGISDSTMRAYVTRGQCPEPDYRLACGPIWRRETAEAWVAKRDQRIERLQRHAAKTIEAETRAATEFVNFQIASRRETNKRNARNRKAARGRTKYLAVPTVRQEARMLAEQMVGRGESSLGEAVIVRHDWALGLLQRRAGRRLGFVDGIPF